MKRFFFALIFCLLPLAAAWAGNADPDQIRLSWEDDATATLTIAWRTVDAGVTESVCHFGETAAHGQQATGTTYTFANATGLHHKVQITGLEPRTVYHLSCGDGGAHMFGDRTFITAPDVDDVCEPVRFVVLGDSRSQIDNGASILWSTVMDAATDEVPDFVVFTGDAIAEGDHVDDGWDDWFDRSHDIGDYPMLIVWGNHDHRGGSPYPQLFHLPVNDASGTDDFWQLRYGYLHLFGLDTEEQPLAMQSPWLEENLAATDALWKFAFFHESAYSSGTTHGSNDDVIDAFCPSFDAHHLDVAFQSHDHTYERTKPIYNGATAGNYNLGTMYIVSGGAGAMVNPIFNIFTFFWEYGIGTWHYVLAEVQFDTLRIAAYDTLGIKLDEVTVVKPDIGNPTASFFKDVDEVHVGEEVVFDGRASVDPCGELTWAWDFGDDHTGDGAMVSHTYNSEGEVTVTLVVTDLDDNTAQFTDTFTVLPALADDDTGDDDTVDDDDTADDDDDTGDDDDDDTGDDDDDDTGDDDATDDDAGDDDSVLDDDDDDDDDGCGC